MRTLLQPWQGASCLAWRGWTALIVGGFAGFLFAAVYGIALLVSGRATK